VASDAVVGRLRREPDAIGSWSDNLPRGRDIVVYGVHGHEASQQAVSGTPLTAASGAAQLRAALDEVKRARS
jgi:hypothetical protein